MDDRDILDIFNALDKYYQKKEAKKCPFCGCDTTNMKFRDKLSEKEFKISGLCQKCQDKTFGC